MFINYASILQDGSSISSPRLAHLSGAVVPVAIQSSAVQLLVRFMSDTSVIDNGTSWCMKKEALWCTFFV